MSLCKHCQTLLLSLNKNSRNIVFLMNYEYQNCSTTLTKGHPFYHDIIVQMLRGILVHKDTTFVLKNCPPQERPPLIYGHFFFVVCIAL